MANPDNHSIIKHADHMILEQPLIRTPLEVLKTHFRATHVIVERESNIIKPALADAAKAFGQGRISKEEATQAIDAQLARLRNSRAKLAAIADEEENAHEQLKARTAHLDELVSISSVDEDRYSRWANIRLDRLLVDYLYRCGHMSSATALADSRDIGNLVDGHLFRTRDKINEAILDRRLTEVLQWTLDNKKELKKMDSPLEFMIRLQQYIEMVRHQTEAKLLEAMSYARRYLAPFKDKYNKEVLQAGGMLCTPMAHDWELGQEECTYRQMWSPNRWNMLSNWFLTAYDNIYKLPADPPLYTALWSGVSALKTPACNVKGSWLAQPKNGTPNGAPIGDMPYRHTECPTCSFDLCHITSAVPYAQHTQSRIAPDQRLFPNGRAYARQDIIEYTKKHGLDPWTKARDPVTGDVYDLSDLRTVYIT